MKKSAGRDTQRLSLDLILTANPHSISNARPREEAFHKGVYTKPRRSPVAPRN